MGVNRFRFRYFGFQVWKLTFLWFDIYKESEPFFIRIYWAVRVSGNDYADKTILKWG